MAKPWAKAFYNSKAWRCCRDSYIAQRILEDGGLCEVCREELGFIVHHVRELTPSNINDPNIALNHSNLRYVCKKCHDKEHGVFCETQRDYFFDENGNIFPIPPLKNDDPNAKRPKGRVRIFSRLARATPLPKKERR